MRKHLKTGALAVGHFKDYDAEYLLEQWAKWTKNTGIALDYPRMTPFRRLLGSTASSHCVLSEEEVAAVDKALASLVERHKETGEVLIMYCLWGGNTSRVARYLKMNRMRVDMLIRCGISWVDAALCSRGERLDSGDVA